MVVDGYKKRYASLDAITGLPSECRKKGKEKKKKETRFCRLRSDQTTLSSKHK